jgi:hypothetical protein
MNRVLLVLRMMRYHHLDLVIGSGGRYVYNRLHGCAIGYEESTNVGGGGYENVVEASENGRADERSKSQSSASLMGVAR